jgi:hypothetical protein
MKFRQAYPLFGEKRDKSQRAAPRDDYTGNSEEKSA